MRIAVDIETGSWDARDFKLGCAYDGKEGVFFETPGAMWKHVCELGDELAAQGKNLYVYAHNHGFDFCGYADRGAEGMKIICENPFWAQYGNIWFLDSYATWRVPLKELGEAMGLEKLEPPEGFFDGKDYNKEELKRYNLRDAEICWHAMETAHKMLTDNGGNCRVLISIGQAAMSAFMNFLEKREYEDRWALIKAFKNGNAPGIYTPRPENVELLRKAARGARVEAFITGKLKGTVKADVNSLYPLAMTEMRTPILYSEARRDNPSIETYKDWIMGETGVTKCKLEKLTDDHGLLPFRNPEGEQIFPREKGTIMIGTWTNAEIEYGVKNELYKLLEVNECVYYSTYRGSTLFRDYILPLYEKKKNAKGAERLFYKNLMNYLSGKFAQTTRNDERMIARSDFAKDCRAAGWEVAGVAGNGCFFFKRVADVERDGELRALKEIPAKNTAFVIYDYITAIGRIKSYEYIRNAEGYCAYYDTDGMVLTEGAPMGWMRFGKELGEWKLEEGGDCTIWGKKQYEIGGEKHFSGLPRAFTPAEIKEGDIKVKKMRGFTDKNAGLFEETDYTIGRKESLPIDKLCIDEAEKIGVDELRNLVRTYLY